jgi:hypothetical protein
MAEQQNNGSPTVNDRFKMPDIYESGIRGANGKSPAQREEERVAKEKADKEAKLAAKRKKQGLDVDDEGDEEEEEKPTKKKRGFVLVPKGFYDKAKKALATSGKKK